MQAQPFHRYEQPRVPGGPRPPRFVVGIPGLVLLYEGDSEIRAWWAWLRHRKQGSEAYEINAWIIGRRSWLYAIKPPLGYFDPLIALPGGNSPNSPWPDRRLSAALECPTFIEERTRLHGS